MKNLIVVLLAAMLAACAVPAPTPTAQPAPADLPTAAPAPTLAAAIPGPLGNSALLVQWMSDREEIVPIDAASGLPLAGYDPIQATPAARSADGRFLAAIEMVGQTCEAFADGSSCQPTATFVDVVDMAGWNTTAKVALPSNGWIGPVSFSPDGRRLAVAYHTAKDDTLLLANAATGKVLSQRPLAFEASLLAFGADGQTLIAYGVAPSEAPGLTPPPPPSVALLDAESLDTAWEASLTEVLSGSWCTEQCDLSHESRVSISWSPAVVVAPNGRALYVVHADADRLRLVDLIEHEVNTVDIQADQAWLDRLMALTAGTAQAKGPMNGAYKSAVLSADGTRLYAVGRSWHAAFDADDTWNLQEEGLGLLEIDPATGQLLTQRDGLSGDLSLAPDGQQLLLHAYGPEQTLVINPDGLEDVGRLSGWQMVSARQINGQPILLASRQNGAHTQIGSIDPETFDLIDSWSVNDYAYWLPMP